MDERADYLVETYSRGMKQRLHLARALVADARVLFLDEPTSGMDPIAAHQFRQLVLQMRGEGRTILLTTHDMAEAESVCDRVTLIDRGGIVAEETPRTLGRLIAENERIDFEGDGYLAEQLREMPGISSVVSAASGGYRVEVEDETATRSALAFLVQSGVTSIRTSRPSLEEVYVHIMSDRGTKV
jgi:ABC-2 type transport system ATP-binding protein